MEQRVLTRLRKNLQVGSEDWNDVLITSQDKDEGSSFWTSTEVSHEKGD